MEVNQNKPPSILKLVLKAIVATILFRLLIFIMIFTIGYVAEEQTSNDPADVLNGCNLHYYRQDYGSLREYLMLFSTEDAAFDLHWEMADGYCDYQQYLQWAATPEEKVPGSVKMAEEYRQKVIDNAENCRFEQNQKQLSEYAKKVAYSQD